MNSNRLIAALVVAGLMLAACGSDADSIATSDSAPPATLPELDDVVVTVSAEELAGERIVLEDLDGDGDMEMTVASADTDEETAGESVTTLVDSTVDSVATTSSDQSVTSDSDGTDDDGLNPFGGDDPEDKRMPDVVCMGLQAAQDEIQDRGVFFSKSVDATGDGRRQIWDRNWIVVSQTPAPGEPIGEREAVLSVVKTDEDNPC